jgi:hypothetical protein
VHVVFSPTLASHTINRIISQSTCLNHHCLRHRVTNIIYYCTAARALMLLVCHARGIALASIRRCPAKEDMGHTGWGTCARAMLSHRNQALNSPTYFASPGYYHLLLLPAQILQTPGGRQVNSMLSPCCVRVEHASGHKALRPGVQSGAEGGERRKLERAVRVGDKRAVRVGGTCHVRGHRGPAQQ